MGARNELKFLNNCFLVKHCWEMFWAPKFKGGIFSTCNQTDLRKHICWSTGIKMSLHFTSFAVLLGLRESVTDFLPFITDFQIKWTRKSNWIFSGESVWVLTYRVATKFSNFREYKDHPGALYKMLIPEPCPHIQGVCEGPGFCILHNVPGETGTGDPWTMCRVTGRGRM